MRIIRYVTGILAVAVVLAPLGLAGQGGGNGSAPPSLKIVEDLVVANHILANEGILDGLGHISVRHDRRPDRFLLSRDRAPSAVTAADIVEFDLNGSPVDPNSLRSYQERYIHAAIYKARPDVNSVIHAHTPSSLVFAISDVPLRPVFHMASFLAGGVPVFEIRTSPGGSVGGMLVNNMTLGNALAQTLGDKPVALMRGHGLVAVGDDIPDAVSTSIFLDVNARIQAQAMAIGGNLTYLGGLDTGRNAPTPAEGVPAPSTGYPRSWEFWVERLEK
jgi:ribulose-5-phosphate 4-epimerase/fuculose-1-phosphate aldolase